MARVTFEPHLADLPQRRNLGSLMAGAALVGQMLARKVFPIRLRLNDMIHARVLLGPAVGIMAGDAEGAVRRRVFYLVAGLATGPEPLEEGGGQRTAGGPGEVAFDTGDCGVLAHERKLRIPGVFELEVFLAPTHRREVALGAGPLELPAVRIFVAVRAVGGQVAELGPSETFSGVGRDVTFFASHVGVFRKQRVLGILIVVEGKLPPFPTRRRMTLGARLVELAPVRVPVAIGAFGGKIVKLS